MPQPGVAVPDDILFQGLALTLAGMGAVFCFLLVLVGATVLLSRLVEKSGAQAQAATDEEVAAIVTAVRQHRRRR